jgi:hypothetical protein
MLGLLCIMLMIDEMFNVRVGLFGPQWSRMGNGFTIMLWVQRLLEVTSN